MKNEYSITKILPVLFGFFIMGLVDLVGIATNYVKQDFALSDILANMLPMTLFLWFALLSVPTGIMMNRFGRRRTVILSMGITLLAMLLPLICNNFPMILIAFGLLGIGNTIIQVSLNPLLTNVVRGDRMTSSLTLGQFIKAIATFLGPIIAGVVAGSFGNWKYVFLFFAIITVISGLWLMLTPIHENPVNQSSSSFSVSFGLLKDTTIFILFLGIVVIVGIDVGLNTTIPKFLMERCDILLEKAGLGTILYFVAKTVGTFVGAILLVKLSGRKFFIVSMLVAIPALLVTLLIGNLWGILSIVFILGFAIANVFSIIFSSALKKFPDVPRFQDFRQMFDKMGKNIDAVSVGTPDCSHFPITMLTMMSKIKGYCLLVFVIIALHLFSCSQQEKLQVDFVDPFIGTADDHGQTDPSANVPFGMIKPGPDTDPGGHGGYDFYARDLRGFSQTRFSGTGCNGVGGNLRVLPFCGKITETIEMDKTTEVARAGYYAVELFNGVKTEITADRTSAIYHFSFPSSSKSGLSIDFNSSFSKFLQEEHDLVGKQAVEGKVKCLCTCNLGRYEFYYYLETDKLPDTVTEQEGKLLWTFESAKDGQVILKIGLSSVSTNDARNNLKTEIGNKTFEQVKQAAGEKWEKLLGVIFVKTGNDSLKRLFYTNLYHACQTPFNIVDHTGTFRGSDGRVYTTSGQSYYHGWSIWDTFRTKYSLFSLLYPEEYKDMMSSLVKLYRQGKVDWATEKEPFLTTRTEHSVIVLLDAFRKGLLRDSLEPVLPYFLDEAKQLSGTSPDKILERCYDYWGISGIAGELGIPNIENQFLKKSKEYRDVWIEKFLKMGEFSDIMHGGGLYEGTLWQYRWFVPHDQDWMVSAIGGREKTIEELDYFFNNNLFNIGNQPDIHVPFLYYYLGEPWKSQKLVQKILLKPTVNYYGTHKKWETPYNGKVFKANPEGYLKEMDDDAGTMSSWFVLSSLGLYPVCPGTPMYWILPPVFDSVSIDVGEGKHFDIKAKRSGEQDIFIRKAILNNENITRSWINYEEIKRGGELILELDSVPNKQWGRECPEIN